MSKPQRNAIAVILRTRQDSANFLAVKRPSEGELGSVWGLPATRMRNGELPEDAARRVCREKLGCNAVPLRFVGAMFQERSAYDMFFMDVEMVLTGEAQPNVDMASTTDGTVYTDQKWTDDAMLLMPAAQGGSCCSTLFLTDQGKLSKDDWLVKVSI
jgi:ADP-ribose pyrophosphatase YjhB (NUDIX family)